MKDIDKYKQEFDKDEVVERITLHEKLQQLASITHKWIYQRHVHKERLAKLADRKIELVIQAEIELQDSNDPKVRALKSQAAKNQYIMNSETVRNIDKEIKSEERTVEYLEEILSTCKFTLPKQCELIVKLEEIENR